MKRRTHNCLCRCSWCRPKAKEHSLREMLEAFPPLPRGIRWTNPYLEWESGCNRSVEYQE